MTGMSSSLSRVLTAQAMFPHRFRNVSRLMDCVGCDKCRLWGKLQTVGYGTAMKVLFEFEDDTVKGQDTHLRRTELVALVNTLDRISHSLSSLSGFRKMLAQRDGHDMPSLPEKAKKLSNDGPQSSGEARPKASPPQVEEDDFDDYETYHPPLPTISEIFWDEWYRVWKAFRIVIRSWIFFPQTL